MLLTTAIENLPNTSSITIRRLKSIGINTYWDLLNYFPFRYENYSLISPINNVQPGETITLQGQIIEAKNLYTKRSLQIQKVIINDNTAKIQANWYNQPYLIRIFKHGLYLSLAGEIKQFGHQLIIDPRSYEMFDPKTQSVNKLIHTGRIIPIYSEKQALSSKLLREKIFWLINQIHKLDELLPEKIISYNTLINQLTAYKNIHFPQDNQTIQKAQQRLAFDELFTIQLSALLTRLNQEKETSSCQLILDKFKKQKIVDFIASLPFKLTSDQEKSTQEIFLDLTKQKPMNRFLQGDVGSGKTVVATIACLLTYLNGYQSLFMAPTEILANQHYQTISSLLKSFDVKIGLLTGSKKIGNWKLEIGNYDIVIGTHALLNKKLTFKKVGLIIIDEQHRFGVSQRAQLKEKGVSPHLLTMTATPIPRTVALALYGELDISYIKEMPRGRLTIKTFFVPKNKRKAGYDWIKNQINSKKIQVFVICPLIEESDHETMVSVKAAVKENQYLKTEIFNRFTVGLLHGKLATREKNQVMEDFRNKKINILVATSIVEVGIDISNATIMIIEGAERYGLAQLHQLRGRIGRGSEQSYCLLFSENENENIFNRLNFFAKNNSGIELAEYDLKHRGPGEIFGTKQHGFIDLKIASLTDFHLIKETKTAVNYFINHYQIDNFPSLKKNVEQYQSKQIANN